MRILDQLWIIPALPLLGAALNGLVGWPLRWSKRMVDSVALGTTGLALLGTLELIREFVRVPADQLPVLHSYFPWIVAGSFRADFALQVDQLTIVMLLVVTGVGWLIHIYSTGYMAHDEGYTRFFSYLNLFMFFMLVLVLAANYVVMFVGWEGVGLSSYLLIGFYYLKKSAADAGKKAFIVNRVGDFGFMLAMFLIYRTFASLDFDKVFSTASPLAAEASAGVITAIALLLFLGAVGKSAQLPLYVWLPDAMEGPTPVSALIHAATMVTAGVYMVARSHILYEHAPIAMLVVAVLGAATALFAATIGLVQNDIKKVLAYSTISQLGYMFLACGVGAFSAGIFHLMTHAFFKGLLFLAAGSVIHAMGGEQDMRNMGGLRKKIPWTYWTMLAATLAIAGAPGFAGFFSKDEILEHAYFGDYGSVILYAVGLTAALLTSFYMFRLLFLIFYGSPRYDEHQVHVHESPRPMVVPLAVLAILSVAGGWFAAPIYWGGVDRFENFLSPVFEGVPVAGAASSIGPGFDVIGAVMKGALVEAAWVFAGIAVGVALIGFLIAWWFYIRRPKAPERLAEALPGPYRLLLHKYYVDEIYDVLIVNPLKWISTKFLWHTVDERVIDGTVNGIADEAGIAGNRVRRVQSGNSRSYAAWVIVGVVLFLVILLRAVR
jgi:NADH-quinone oxidoreductase subunit L